MHFYLTENLGCVWPDVLQNLTIKKKKFLCQSPKNMLLKFKNMLKEINNAKIKKNM